VSEVAQVDRGAKADDRLPEELGPGGKPLRVAVHDLAVVVHPADGAEGDGDQEHHPKQSVGEVAPQERGDADGDEDERPAHRGRACLGEVRARSVVAHRLPDLVRGELADEVRAENERHGERGEAGEHCAQREVVEDVEQPHVLRQPLGDLEEHQ
jgi:hypothetical protein